MFLTESQFRDALHWYQKKIGSYDQQVWEKSIEERVLRGLSHAIPKKVARVKKESIDLDLDLIRGSYFAKAKPQQSWLTTTYLGIVRIILFPFYLNWWTEQTNPLICAILFILYCLQMISMYIYFNSEKDEFDEIPISEVVSPLFMFFILGTMQSQIGASSSSKNRSYRSRLNQPTPTPPSSSSLSTITTTATTTTAMASSSLEPIASTSSKSTSKSDFIVNDSNQLNIVHSSPSSSNLKRNSRTKSSKNDDTIIGLCKNCSKRDALKESLKSTIVKSNSPSSSSSSSSIDTPVDKSSSTSKFNPLDESKVSDDESGLDSMETPNGTPKEEDDDEIDNDDEAEEDDDDERETCLRKRKVLIKHLNNGNSTLTNEEDGDNSDNSSSHGSCSPSADQSPSTSIPSSAKSTPGYSGRQKSFTQKISDSESTGQRVAYEVKKEVNTDTEPDETIGDLSSADECSPYSTVDSNNRFEWSRKYNITSATTGLPIDVRHDTRCKQSPVDFCIPQVNNGDQVSSRDKNIKSKNVPDSSNDHNDGQSIKGQRGIINKPKLNSTTQASSLSTTTHHHHRLQFCLPVSCSKSVAGGTGGSVGGGVDGCSSSGESECSMSPTSPITKLASDLDWPSINSDGTSDDEGEIMMGVDVDVSSETLRKLNENQEFFDFDEQTARSLSNHHHHTHTHHHHHHSHPKSHSHHHHHREDHHHHHHHQYHHHHHTPSISYSPEESNSFNQRNGKPLNDKVSCAIWQMRECQKVDLSVLDISSAIIRKVESVKHSNEYFYLGFLLSLVLAFIPVIFRIRQLATSPRFSETRRNKVTQAHYSSPNSSKEILSDIIQEIPTLATDLLAETMVHSFSSFSVQFVVLVAIIERFFLSLCFFFLLCVAERTFRERFLYAKYFCHLTSSRRARRSDLPHFRLNKVRNIKTWLSVRSYLQNHGPQRSIDAIVSSSFIVEVSILTFLCIQLLRDNEICSEKLYCWEMVFWNLAIGLYIMRLIILGSKMNRKSRGCLTILLSEQINLYLQLEQKPHKKEDLTLANQLIKSAADVLKLLEAPFKISGFSANPYLYNITKVIVLSAFSAVLTELLGFKLKLYKIKLTS